MSKIDITIKEKNRDIDGEYKFDLDMDINALKTFVSSKFNNFKPVRLFFEGKELNNGTFLREYNLVTGDIIEYETTTQGGKRSRKVKKTKKTRKSKKHRRTKRHH